MNLQVNLKMVVCANFILWVEHDYENILAQNDKKEHKEQGTDLFSWQQ